MAIALETFVKQLEESGVLSAGKLQNFLPPKAAPKDAQELARELVKSKHLTKYQVQEIYAGRAKSMILGNYTILDRIGAGGMGQVFKAEHRRMDRIVAIKMLPVGMMKDAVAAARFEREVKAAAKLEHPHIVAAHDADEANGVHFLVMQYVDGSDLSALVKTSGPLPVAKAVDCILQAARGLEYAHQQGVIHRDIKPANLLLDRAGNVKILDMGLARIEGGGYAATQAELTGTGAVMGTVDYMAPEQAMSTKHADARSDIYSLGVTLWYLLTGRAMYDGETMVEKLMGHQAKPIPSLCEACSDVPEALEQVYRRMVAKSAGDRYQTMSEVIAELVPITTGAQTSSGIDQTVATEPDSGLLSFLKDSPAPTTHKSAKKTTIKPAPADAKVESTAPNRWRRKQKRLALALGGVALAIACILAASFAFRVNGPGKAEKVAKAKATAVEMQENFGLEFDGVDDYVDIPSLTYNDPARPICFEAWVVPHSDTAVSHVITLHGPTALSLHQEGAYWYSNRIRGNGQESIRPESAPVVPGTRVHLAASWDGARQRLFVDGKISDQVAPNIAEPFSTQGSVIAAGRTLAPILKHFFAGKIENIRISSTARYTADFTPEPRLRKDDATLALYHFDEGQGEELRDSSGNNHHGKIVGAKWVRGDNEKAPAAKPAPSHAETLANPAFQQWMKDVAAMPAEKQVEAVSKKLVELNPEFDGKLLSPADASGSPVVQDGHVVGLLMSVDNVADLSPIRALPELRQINCVSKQNTGRRLDLSPLTGIGIRTLYCANVDLDLSIVKKLPLIELACYGGITNLTPLSGMQLRKLTVAGNWNLASLEPLHGMPLTSLAFDNCQVADLSPLSGMKLTLLMCHVSNVAELSPLKGMPLEELYCDRTPIADLSPLAGMKLKKMSFTPSPNLKGLEAIRQMDSLLEIGTAYDKLIPTKEFWNKYDAGEFGK